MSHYNTCWYTEFFAYMKLHYRTLFTNVNLFTTDQLMNLQNYITLTNMLVFTHLFLFFQHIGQFNKFLYGFHLSAQ